MFGRFATGIRRVTIAAAVAAAALTASAGARTSGAAMPAAPRLLRLVGAPTFAVRLAWSSAAGADEYQVVRNGTTVATSHTTGYLDQTVTGPQRFTYAVRAVGAGGTSPLSNEKTIFVPAETDPIATIPRSRRAIPVNAVGIAAIVVRCSAFTYACGGRLTLAWRRQTLGSTRFALRGGTERLTRVLLSDAAFTLLIDRGRLAVNGMTTTNNGVSGATTFARRLVLKAPRSGSR